MVRKEKGKPEINLYQIWKNSKTCHLQRVVEKTITSSKKEKQ